MSAPQTSVLTQYPVGIAGQLVDLNSLAVGDTVSAVNAEASAEIPFGVMVKPGTGDDDAKLLTANSNILKGVVVFGHLYDYPVERGDIGIKPGIQIGLLRKAKIWVKVEDAVTPASEVHVRAVAGVGEQAGAFRGSADTTDCIEITPFARFLTTAGAGELAVLSIDLDNAALAAADA